MLHRLKIRKEYADAIISGDKTFEVRLNDRGYKVGDLVRFSVLPPDYSPIVNNTYVITYILDSESGYGLKDGWVAFGIKQESLSENHSSAKRRCSNG